MPRFRAVLIFPDAGEARYEFDAPDDFLAASAARVMDTFLNTVDGLDLPGAPVHHEINSANAHRSAGAVTASGSIQLRDGAAVPFVAMISQAKAAA